jgi:SAM-dependent methyltransferase
MKQAVRAVLPTSVLRPIQRLRYRKVAGKYRSLSTKDIFTKIYNEGAWGQSDDKGQAMYSGTGSHNDALVAPYIDAVRTFLKTYAAKPDVVDLGCGNFYLGSRLRDLCGRYTACDIVEPVIASNKAAFADLDVDFRVVDMARDALPAADVVFVRQVFQHLSNAEIGRALEQIKEKYRVLVLTEHLPKGTFTPNIDKATGPDIRLGFNSGVVLTSAPFNLVPKETSLLCEVEENGGIIRTLCYRLA